VSEFTDITQSLELIVRFCLAKFNSVTHTIRSCIRRSVGLLNRTRLLAPCRHRAWLLCGFEFFKHVCSVTEKTSAGRAVTGPA
ncbi:MAG: hypothetical protein ACK56F_08195, partial [bacterium]